MTSGVAAADVSSWIYTGAGPAWVWHRENVELYPALRLEAGLGTPPSRPIIVGGLFRVEPRFGHSTDLAVLVRTATRQFVNGGWGLALDLGGAERVPTWSPGVTGSLVIGGPWGLTASAGSVYGTDDAASITATLGFDFARLTVYRRSGAQWWENPFPAYRPEEDTRKPK